MQTGTVDVEKLVRVFIRMRDAKEEIQARHKAELEEIKKKMAKIETALKQAAQTSNVTSFKTDVGTATIVQNVKASCDNWDLLWEFITKSDVDPMLLLEKKVKATGVREYMEEHEGAIPPGVSIFKELSVRVTAKR